MNSIPGKSKPKPFIRVPDISNRRQVKIAKITRLHQMVSGYWGTGLLKFSEKIKAIQKEFEKSLQDHNTKW